MSSISRGLRGRRPLRSAMRLKLIRRSARRRALVDAAVTAYAQWRSECAAVRGAYHRWVAAGAGNNAVCVRRVQRRGGSRGAGGKALRPADQPGRRDTRDRVVASACPDRNRRAGAIGRWQLQVWMIIDQSARSRRLVDGGVVNNTPISHAVELGARSGSTSSRQRIRRTVRPTTRRGPHSTQRSVGFGRSSTAGWRPTSPGTRRRSS